MWKDALKKKLSCDPEKEKYLASLSTLGVGGACEIFLEPSDSRDVSELFKVREWECFPLYILGGGSNVVFADGLVRGVVLSSRRLNSFQWHISEQGATLGAECGYLLPKAVSDSAKAGLTGAEFAVGIPGTLGGALAGNAGTGGYSICDLLEEVTTVESDGSVKNWKRDELDHSYRYFSLTSSGRFFSRCKLAFKQAPYAEIEGNLSSFRQARKSQPHGVRSAGCVFKNPEGESAGRLLDMSGCKGLRAGDAVVSDVHANFFINKGHATGADIFELMRTCRDIVFSKTGVSLETEIRFLGFSL